MVAPVRRRARRSQSSRSRRTQRLQMCRKLGSAMGIASFAAVPVLRLGIKEPASRLAVPAVNDRPRSPRCVAVAVAHVRLAGVDCRGCGVPAAGRGRRKTTGGVGRNRRCFGLREIKHQFVCFWRKQKRVFSLLCFALERSNKCTRSCSGF